MKAQVLIADDYTLVRDGIRALLEYRLGLEVVAEAGDGQEAVELAARTNPALVLIEPALCRLNGVEATRRIRSARPTTRVLALAGQSERSRVGQMLQAGAAGYVLKTAPFEQLKQGIETVLAGGSYLAPEVADIVVDQYVRGEVEACPGLASLTPREREVLQLLAEGHPGRTIAEMLGVSIKTVDTHRYQVMKKLKLRNLADLTRYALREGLVTLAP